MNAIDINTIITAMPRNILINYYNSIIKDCNNIIKLYEDNNFLESYDLDNARYIKEDLKKDNIMLHTLIESEESLLNNDGIPIHKLTHWLRLLIQQNFFLNLNYTDLERKGPVKFYKFIETYQLYIKNI
jgi:hypothetical protein